MIARSLFLAAALTLLEAARLVAAPFTISPDSRPFIDAPDALGIAVEGDKTSDDDSTTALTATSEFTIQFPDAMVAPDRIDAADSPSPVTLWPDLNAKWIWRTQSQGTWTADGPVIPGQAYRMRLREDLRTLAGDMLDAKKWGYKLATPDFTVSADYNPEGPISARPQVPLEFNYPMRLSDAAEGCWFQDRLTRQRFPVEVLLNRAVSEATGDVVDVTKADAQTPPTEFRVRPRDPLPVGRFYDLVVDGMRNAYAGRTLPYPRVFALGRTAPLTIDYVAARNDPTDKPRIEVKFKGRLGDDPLPADALKIEPAVPHLTFRREGEFLFADGVFDLSTHYRVTIAAGLTGELGYPLAKAETWGATFHPKQATLPFPGGTIR
jgi:hypothetical protein